MFMTADPMCAIAVRVSFLETGWLVKQKAPAAAEASFFLGIQNLEARPIA